MKNRLLMILGWQISLDPKKLATLIEVLDLELGMNLDKLSIHKNESHKGKHFTFKSTELNFKRISQEWPLSSVYVSRATNTKSNIAESAINFDIENKSIFMHHHNESFDEFKAETVANDLEKIAEFDFCFSDVFSPLNCFFFAHGISTNEMTKLEVERTALLNATRSNLNEPKSFVPTDAFPIMVFGKKITSESLRLKNLLAEIKKRGLGVSLKTESGAQELLLDDWSVAEVRELLSAN